MTLTEYCVENHMEYLLEEWDTQKNTGYVPEMLPFASHREVWWQCGKGHSWKTSAKDRTKRPRMCPYCAGKLPIPGETDLATLYPDLAGEWHPSKNGDLKPEDVTPGSAKKVWWQCGMGHEWEAEIENRALKGNVCPYCAGKKAWPGYNDLATEYPELMKEWCYEYNTKVDPTRIRPHSAKRVYWRCGEGHVWDSYVYNRTSKKRPGCPVCAGRTRQGR